MFPGIGWPEMLVIGAAALLLFGPKRLPELAKNLGKGIRDFKKAMEGSEDETEKLDGKTSTAKSVELEKEKTSDPIKK